MAVPFKILVVEDDLDDQYLIQSAFEGDRDTFQLQFAEDPTQVISRLDDPSLLADLVLLDLNMPVVNGFQVLRELRNSPAFRNTPVLVFTTSSRQEDIDRAYALGANSFIIKPTSYDKLDLLADQVRLYWSISELPARKARLTN